MSRLQKLGYIIACGFLIAVGYGGYAIAQEAPKIPESQTQTITKQVVLQWPLKTCGSRLEVNDQNGAPMFWINCWGATSGAEPVCMTDLSLVARICIGGIYGNYGGRPTLAIKIGGQWQQLTGHDIIFVHRMERKFKWLSR